MIHYPWWRILSKGIISVLLALSILVWPIIMISLLVVSLGSYIFIDGIFSVIRALKKRRREEMNWDWLFLNGLFGLLAGVLTFFNPFVILAVATFLLLRK